MGKLVSYERSEGVSTITVDDGKVNAMSVAMMQEINAALDQAEEHRSVVILSASRHGSRDCRRTFEARYDGARCDQAQGEGHDARGA